jgi:SAM-dependent methyltransferase
MSDGILDDPLYCRVLSEIDRKIGDASLTEIPQLLDPLPLDVFALVCLNCPPQYPNLAGFLPTMPSEDLQRQWVGASGIPLITQSVGFLRSVVSCYQRHCLLPLSSAKVLDYGCGWGRMLRLFYKYVPVTSLFGADPQKGILEVCRKMGVRGNLAHCDHVPRQLPFRGEKFDLVVAFSVFTHLSEECHKAVLSVLHQGLTPEGILVVSIRPRNYWSIGANGSDEEKASLMAAHDNRGYAFKPHHRAPAEGETTYGRTSISREYIEQNWNQWRLIETDYNLCDPYQIICILKKT